MMIAVKIKMTTDKQTIRLMCQAVVAEADPGHHALSFSYVDLDSWEIHVAELNRARNPWNDNARVVAVDECFDLADVDVSAQVDWRDSFSSLPSHDAMLKAYCEAENAREDNGDLADWVDYATVVEWASSQSDWAAEIEEFEDAAHEAAIDLVESCLLPEIEYD